ncbi:hypothetical protein BpHYR1_027972 [Brachionus plicatilis]|uniref:Uncharacterized protein n=1 Tax=Brachionus plicatilis TaxID=10195 RepID=A0A3M7RL12_BRAPC|nr:hypothetical protein BpHYR1_027972 [Brachionus plicatilis]
MKIKYRVYLIFLQPLHCLSLLGLILNKINNTIINDYVDEVTPYDDVEDFTDDERYILDENNEEATPETIERNNIVTTQPSASSTNSSSSIDRLTLCHSPISVYQGNGPTTSNVPGVRIIVKVNQHRKKQVKHSIVNAALN